MTDVTEADAVAALAQAGAIPNPLDEQELYSIVVPSGGEQQILDLEGWLPSPRRPRGTVTVKDVASFVPYFKRHGDDLTFLYADRDNSRVVAVFNDDESGVSAGWRDHRAVLQLKHTPEWEHWANQSGRLLTQEQFAEHIELGLAEIVSPDAADMLELAQTFHAQTNSEFRSSVRLASGQRQFTFVEETDARAGKTGNLAVPETFTLGVAPWLGCDRFKVTARLRYRLTAGKLLLGYLLERPHEVLDAAFGQITDQLTAETSATVLRGTAASPRA
jgi:uncharacterized protein YfdQ (DUF2303 family)